MQEFYFSSSAINLADRVKLSSGGVGEAGRPSLVVDVPPEFGVERGVVCPNFATFLVIVWADLDNVLLRLVGRATFTLCCLCKPPSFSGAS